MTNPTLVTTPFAENGDKNTIPQSVGAEPQNATQDEGFPEITQTPISAGGIPPERKDFNGILNLYGQHIVHLNKGLPYEFDAAFATAIGGYPLHARIALSNGDIVRNTVANNSSNPNSDMTGWIFANDSQNIKTNISDADNQKLYNDILLSIIQSTSDLSSIAVWPNRIVRTRAFSANGSPFGSAIYKYTNSAKPVDNIFVFASSGAGVWELLSNNEINIYQCGLVADGVTDESVKFIDIVAKVKAKALADKRVYKLVGLNSQIIINQQFTVDLAWVNLKDLSIYAPNFLPTTFSALCTFTNTYSAGSSERQKFYGEPNYFENVSIFGNPLARDASSGIRSIGVRFSTNAATPFANGAAKGLIVSYFYAGHCYGSNFYLFEFNRCQFDRNYISFIDAREAGFETSISNAGENIRYNVSTFTNSAKIWASSHQWFVFFDEVSLDYTGGNSTVNLTQFDLGGAEVLVFQNCHFESGNINNCWTEKFFNCTSAASAASVSLIGGAIIASGTYNNIPYFFYSANEFSTFSIDDTFIFGTSVRGTWANKGLVKWLPKVNNANSQVPQRIQETSTLLCDYNFTKSTAFLDDWFAGGTRTSATASDQVLLELTTLPDSTTKALKVTKLIAGACSFGIDVRLFRNNYRPTALFTVVSGTIASARSIFATAALFRESRINDAYGVRNMKGPAFQIWSTTATISATLGTIQTVSVASQVEFKQANQGYDLCRYSFNLVNLAANEFFYITLAQIDQPF